MTMQFLSNLPQIGESIAKVASEGGQLIADFISLYGFFAFCLVFVGFCLVIPVRIYEKYYSVADDEADHPVALSK
ncbi:hypothetical protein [Cohnella sp. GCM10027633]|uniref:hypothetical protein n=1 Tax=unclassified Cohnella TaxID=2636738 RepID=UPI003630254A